MSTTRELCNLQVQVKHKFASGVGHSKVPDASDEWRSAGFTQYLANTDDEFCSSWELELSVSNRLLTALAHCFYRSRIVCIAPLFVRCFFVCWRKRFCLGGQEMERRQSQSRSKPSAVTPNNPVWQAMLCAPALLEHKVLLPSQGTVLRQW